jgi:hypothetical protein
MFLHVIQETNMSAENIAAPPLLPTSSDPKSLQDTINELVKSNAQLTQLLIQQQQQQPTQLKPPSSTQDEPRSSPAPAPAPAPASPPPPSPPLRRSSFACGGGGGGRLSTNRRRQGGPSCSNRYCVADHDCEFFNDECDDDDGCVGGADPSSHASSSFYAFFSSLLELAVQIVLALMLVAWLLGGSVITSIL